MKKYIKIFTLLTLISCGSPVQRLKWVCTCEQQKEVAKFVKETVGDANNMSDEEMEDVVKELKQTGIELHCGQRLMWTKRQHPWRVIPDSLKLGPCEVLMN